MLSLEQVERFRCATKLAGLSMSHDFGGLGFPFLRPGMGELNQLVLHPAIISSCKQLLGNNIDTLVLSQAELWFKRGSNGEETTTAAATPLEFRNTDQRMHMDFPNHYLTCTPPWHTPDAVAMIVYLDDDVDCGAQTRIVPRNAHSVDAAYAFPQVLKHMPGVGEIPWINDRTAAEDYLQQHHQETFEFRQALYARERPIAYKRGTVLFYRLDVWHRGTPMLSGEHRQRAVVNLLFKRTATATHLTNWHKGWATNAYNSWALPNRTFPPEVGAFELLLQEQLSAEQRTCLGFPSPLNTAYWTREMIQAVKQRYPRMDMSEYYEAARL